MKFLDKIDYVKWKHEGDNIEIFRGKGRRIDDFFLYSAQKYMELKKKEEKERIAIEALDKKQKRLEEWF